MTIIKYNREQAVEYAGKWAYKRNPKYMDFSDFGGDCTNFASQCLYAGCGIMNYTKTYGWYYNNGMDKAPAWSGTPELYRFLITNNSVGPFGKEVPLEMAEVGDLIQLRITGNRFHHTPVIISIKGEKIAENIYVAAHTIDSYDRSLSTYDYKDIRCIHIENYRVY